MKESVRFITYWEGGKFYGTSCSIFAQACYYDCCCCCYCCCCCCYYYYYYYYYYLKLSLKHEYVIQLCQEVTGVVSSVKYSFGNILNLGLVFFCHETFEYLDGSS